MKKGNASDVLEKECICYTARSQWTSPTYCVHVLIDKYLELGMGYKELRDFKCHCVTSQSEKFLPWSTASAISVKRKRLGASTT